MNQDVAYPILYGAMRGTLKSIAYSHNIPGVEVKDMDAFAKHSAALGYPLSDGPHKTSTGSVIAFVDAPEGYEIELIQPAS